MKNRDSKERWGSILKSCEVSLVLTSLISQNFGDPIGYPIRLAGIKLKVGEVGSSQSKNWIRFGMKEKNRLIGVWMNWVGEIS